MDLLTFHLQHSTTIKVTGPTRCGQTWLVRRILEEQLIQPFATLIICVFNEWQPEYDMIRERYPGIPWLHMSLIKGGAMRIMIRYVMSKAISWS